MSICQATSGESTPSIPFGSFSGMIPPFLMIPILPVASSPWNRAFPKAEHRRIGGSSAAPSDLLSASAPPPVALSPHARTAPMRAQGPRKLFRRMRPPPRISRKLEALRVSLSSLAHPRESRAAHGSRGRTRGPARDMRRSIMSNLNEKATRAASRCLEHRGCDILEEGWASPPGPPARRAFSFLLRYTCSRR